jgi:2-polyprenyl-3-methyl-5-hydroxy-6-metoxy-1,4-benzoquinol methylase
MAQNALDWACAQFPPDVQSRGIARGYYEYLWNLDEIIKALGTSLSGARVIDVGCGAGVMALAFRSFGADVVAVDRFDEYEESRDNQMGGASQIVNRLEANGITIVRRDFVAEGLPLTDPPFDLVTCFAVIEHLHESPRASLQAMFNGLRPGGHIIVTTPNHAWLRTRLRLAVGRSVHFPLETWWQTPFHGHVREYTSNELRTMLQWAGFEVVRSSISSWGHVSSRLRASTGDGHDRWTTRFTLDSPARYLVGASLLLTALVPSLGYSMLAIGHKPVVADGRET